MRQLNLLSHAQILIEFLHRKVFANPESKMLVILMLHYPMLFSVRFDPHLLYAQVSKYFQSQMMPGYCISLQFLVSFLFVQQYPYLYFAENRNGSRVFDEEEVMDYHTCYDWLRARVLCYLEV